ncbi:peptidylprolyl isomerase [Gallionella capsiferriformans]|uniref:Chaperone SurA n=1 Tax=Gallionella capsiferriformans (strain ES-2) TaxID=395494 RepID=D9SID4_GALCS|nr:peptidylprolyl isomerase [Gallionella capsiferriformans]ADL54191.1 SurA domain [Gallionella capsiferriformans ES-2]
MSKIKFPVLLSVLSLMSTPVLAVEKHVIEPQQQVATIDAVVAVVNDDVITRLELNERLRMVVSQLKKQGTPLPEGAVLETQVLERMIAEMLQAQFAKENGVRVDDTQLDMAITRIAQQNNFPSLVEFMAKLESDGVNVKKFREEIRAEIVSTRLREREVESKLVISDTEVDNYLSNKSKMGLDNDEYHLAHILVVVPEQASAEKIRAARERADQAFAQLSGGADFSQVSAGFSDAKDALKGGDLGWRAGDRIPPAFMNELQNLKPGQNTAVLRSPSGFHILKLVEKRGGSAPVVITQTHARHILIKTSEIVTEAEAKKQLLEIKQRIDGGAGFAEQAKRYSQDGSAQQGGDLDWLSPGQTVPEFEGAINKLQVGQMGMVQTQFGWHLIQVLARRNTDVSEQQKRQQARVSIGTFKSEELYQDWLRQLRDRAFVEYRLEEK